MMASIFRIHSVNVRMIDELRIGKDLEGIGLSLIEVLCRIFSRVTEENLSKIAGFPVEIRIEDIPNTSKRYLYARGRGSLIYL
jgi:hypothetical protein